MALKLSKQKSIFNENKSILDGLNPEQRRAVESINGPVLVVAGAGSGKTRVLTHRIAQIIHSGVEPWKILALTFTNKAAREMVERISKLLTPAQASAVWAGTFHSIFARILRTEADEIGYTSSFSIYDAEDSLRVIRLAMQNLGINQQQYPAQGMRARISSAKNKMITAGEYRRNAETLIEKQTSEVYEEYERITRSNNSMDFDDLLLNFILLLGKDKSILNKYQEKFKYLLVDEYQDTNRAQYVAINMLAKAHSNICVVGDDAQSIYRWRGAEIQNILDFQKDYPMAKIIRLEQNYRSTKNILAAADSVIKHNRNQLPKNLWTDNPDGDKIEIHACPDDRSESSKVTEIIRDNIAKGYSLSDMAVLYRTNAQSLSLENSLRRENYPYVIVGGTSFYKRKEVKDTLAYLRILVNQQDSEAFTRIVNEPPRGLGQTSMRHITHHADKYEISMYEAMSNAQEIDGLQARAVKSAKKFANYLAKYINQMQNEQSAGIFVEFIEESGLLEMYKEINTEDALDRWNNIQQLLSDIGSFFRANDDATLEAYLQQISLVADIDEKDISGEKVTLMTLHSAKGLEFPVVFITGLEHGLFPLMRAEMHPEEEEEERRLFYVGLTRAEEKLYLTYARNRMRFGQTSAQSPSHFIKEITPSLLKWIGDEPRRPAGSGTQRLINQAQSQRIRKPQQNRPQYSQMPPEETYSQIPREESDFKIGDRVKHSQFGEGKIVNLGGAGTQRKAMVHFNSVGRKQLLLQYAKLEKLG
jgi:DNA helicase-2/ATP-dependent DNA helicase PcrA